MIVTIIAFILIFSLVVFVHELGHWYFARRAGVRVEEFGFGLPPRIWGRKKGDTIYSINLIPFGGFVRLYGENDEDKAHKHAFTHKTPWQKFTIVVGGVCMNILLGYLFIMVGFWLKMPPLVTPAEQYVADPGAIQSTVLVAGVTDKSAAAAAGILPGDVILSAGQTKFSLPAEFKSFIQTNGLKPIQLNLDRAGEPVTVAVTPVKNAEGKPELGVLIDQNIERVSYIWWQVPWLALQETGKILLVVLMSIIGLIYKLFTTASLPAGISGPVGIARLTADVVSLGWLRIMQFVAFLSLNLGVINLIPFPGLDGGRLVFILAEWLRRGKKIPGYIENALNTVGFVLLILLIAVVTYKDIIKLI